MALDIEVLADADAVAERAAAFVVDQARAAAADHGRLSFAISGGRTPWAMFRHLAGALARSTPSGACEPATAPSPPDGSGRRASS